jgi:hypothetical protein
MKMKRMMILITMMLPLMTFASLFSERSGEIFQATREGPGEGVVEPDAPRAQSKVGGVV